MLAVAVGELTAALKEGGLNGKHFKVIGRQVEAFFEREERQGEKEEGKTWGWVRGTVTRFHAQFHDGEHEVPADMPYRFVD